MRFLLCIAAAAPFIPGAFQFIRRGLPDILFTGDGAAIELRVLHAAHGAQLVGPYSRFDWSHPGPMFFYLALPVYEAFGRRGPALNLFAFVANLACAIAMVLTARRLRGDLFALVVAALFAVYALIGVPRLLSNEWNPVFPMIPLALLSFLAVRIALEGAGPITTPAFVFIASLIVQTHIGYAPEVVAVAIVAVVGRWWLGSASRDSRSLTADRRIRLVSAAVLIVCWSLPLYEAASMQPGNLQLIAAFFRSGTLAAHTWSAAITTVFEQMAVLPRALARTLGLTIDAPGSAGALAGAELVGVLAALVAGLRRRDRSLTVLAAMVVLQIAVAVGAVRGIRGDLEFYLVIWTSLLGLMSFIVAAAWLISAPSRPGINVRRSVVAVGAVLMLALAIIQSWPGPSVFRARDADADQLAGRVEAHLRSTAGDPVMIRIVSRDTWPSVAAVVLHLYKRRVPVSVEPAWLFVVGKPFAPQEGARHRSLFFGDHDFDALARSRQDVSFVASTNHVFVYMELTHPRRGEIVEHGTTTSPAEYK